MPFSKNENENKKDSSYDSLKSQIYTLYTRVCAAHFFNTNDLFVDDFDRILALVCVSHLNYSVSYEEFNELCNYLVRTYHLYKIEGSFL